MYIGRHGRGPGLAAAPAALELPAVGPPVRAPRGAHGRRGQLQLPGPADGGPGRVKAWLE